MDSMNLEVLEASRPSKARAKTALFLSYAPDAEVRDVPDPYCGGPQQFDFVLDLLEAGSRGLLSSLRAAHPEHFAA